MVYMGRYPDRELLQRKHDELKRLKHEAEELRASPDLPPGLLPGLSLGRFDSRPAADAALAGMLKHGVRTARVVMLRPAQELTLVRLPLADVATRARLAGLRLPALSKSGFVACPGADNAGSSAPLPTPPPGAGSAAGTPATAARPAQLGAAAANPASTAAASAAQPAAAASNQR